MGGTRGVDLYSDEPAPVRELLRIGEVGCYARAEWPDYPKSFGLDQQHVGALIRMACDRELHNGDPDSSAPGQKNGRNDQCPCGSRRKYKKCCLK